MQPSRTSPPTGFPAAVLGRTVGLSVMISLALASAACGGPGPVDPRGEWAGTLKTVQGRCPDARASRFLVDGKDLSFVPGGGVLVLHGTRKPDSNTFHAQLLLADMSRKPLPMVFEGTLAPDGSRIDATYGTPACRATVTLLRPQHDALQRVLGN